MKKSSNNIYSCTGLAKVFSFTLSQTFKNRAYRVSYIMFIVLMMVMGPINQLGMSAGMGAAHSTDAINDEMDLKQIYFVNDTYLDFSAEKLIKAFDSLCFIIVQDNVVLADKALNQKCGKRGI